MKIAKSKEYGEIEVGKLTNELKQQLAELSQKSSIKRCSVICKDGQKVENILVLSKREFESVWGKSKYFKCPESFINLDEVSKFIPSINSVTDEVEDMLRKLNETGMGFTLFEVKFKGLFGGKVYYGTGRPAYFFELPDGKLMQDIKLSLIHI